MINLKLNNEGIQLKAYTLYQWNFDKSGLFWAMARAIYYLNLNFIIHDEMQVISEFENIDTMDKLHLKMKNSFIENDAYSGASQQSPEEQEKNNKIKEKSDYLSEKYKDTPLQNLHWFVAERDILWETIKKLPLYPPAVESLSVESVKAEKDLIFKFMLKRVSLINILIYAKDTDMRQVDHLYGFSPQNVPREAIDFPLFKASMEKGSYEIPWSTKNLVEGQYLCAIAALSSYQFDTTETIIFSSFIKSMDEFKNLVWKATGRTYEEWNSYMSQGNNMPDTIFEIISGLNKVNSLKNVYTTPDKIDIIDKISCIFIHRYFKTNFDRIFWNSINTSKDAWVRELREKYNTLMVSDYPGAIKLAEDSIAWILGKYQEYAGSIRAKINELHFDMLTPVLKIKGNEFAEFTDELKDELLNSKKLPSYAPDGNPWDIVVIGGGPIGLTAAKCAVNRGMKVILLEKESKCGPAPRAETITESGLANTVRDIWGSEFIDDFMNSARLNQVNKMRIYAPFGLNSSEVPVCENPHIFLWEPFVNKMVSILKEKAVIKTGVEVIDLIMAVDRHIVKGVKTNKGEVYSKMVIDCSGHNSKFVSMYAGVDHKKANYYMIKARISNYCPSYKYFQSFFITAGALDMKTGSPPVIAYIFPTNDNPGHDAEVGCVVFEDYSLVGAVPDWGPKITKEYADMLWGKIKNYYPFNTQIAGAVETFHEVTETTCREFLRNPLGKDCGYLALGEASGFMLPSNVCALITGMISAQWWIEEIQHFKQDEKEIFWSDDIVRHSNERFQTSEVFLRVEKEYKNTLNNKILIWGVLINPIAISNILVWSLITIGFFKKAITTIPLGSKSKSVDTDNSAIEGLLKSAELDKNTGNSRFYADKMYNIGKLYYMSNNLPAAVDALNKSYRQYQSIGDLKMTKAVDDDIRFLKDM